MESAKQVGHELAQEKYQEMQIGDGESRPRFFVITVASEVESCLFAFQSHYRFNV